MRSQVSAGSPVTGCCTDRFIIKINRDEETDIIIVFHECCHVVYHVKQVDIGDK